MPNNREEFIECSSDFSSRSIGNDTVGGNAVPLTSVDCSTIFCTVKKTILVYGLLGGVLIALLKGIEYRYLVVEHSLEIYGGLVAIVFASVGIWLGLKLT